MRPRATVMRIGSCLLRFEFGLNKHAAVLELAESFELSRQPEPRTGHPACRGTRPPGIRSGLLVELRAHRCASACAHRQCLSILLRFVVLREARRCLKQAPWLSADRTRPG